MRIFVFRPESDAKRTAQAIAARGHEAILAPLFTLVRLPASIPEGPFDALVLTSSNAVPTLADGPAIWRDGPVFTVGARTADAVRAVGYTDARSAGGDRHDLFELISRNMPAGARLLMIVGRDRHEDLPQRLTEAGFSVESLVAYAAEPVSVLPEIAAKAIANGEADAALHYSARGAETFIRLAGAVHLGEEAMALTQVALSVEVAAPLIAAGATTVLVAEHPEEAALLAALDEVSGRFQTAARIRDGENARQTPVAPLAGEMDKDAMINSDNPARSASRSRRTPPTIDMKAASIADAPVATPAAAETPPGEASIPAGAAMAPESVLPTEALPQEFSPPPVPEPDAGAAAEVSTTTAPATSAPAETAGLADRAPASAPPPQRSLLPAMALAGIVGGVIGAGLVLLALSRTTPAASPEEIAALRGQVETLRTQTAAAAKAGADAQAASARATELASAQRAQPADAGAIAGATDQARRAEAAATAIGQRLDQAAARIGSVETLARTAAAPSPQALAAARIVLAERVQTALASGRPFAEDVAALARGGGAPEQLAALTAVASTGAPTRDALLAGFKSHQALFAREMTPAASGWKDQLLGVASRIVTIRPVGDTGANDPATLVMRLENAISGGRFGTAAGLWGQLPEPARRASAEFGTNLQKRAAAEAAIATIARDAVSALGAAG